MGCLMDWSAVLLGRKIFVGYKNSRRCLELRMPREFLALRIMSSSETFQTWLI